MKKITGRPPIDEEPAMFNLTVRFTKKELDELKEVADKVGISKARLVKLLALTHLEETRNLAKSGNLIGIKKLSEFKDIFLKRKNLNLFLETQ